MKLLLLLALVLCSHAATCPRDRHALRRTLAQIRALQTVAAQCGERDVACSEAAYRNVANEKARASALRRKLGSSACRPASKKHRAYKTHRDAHTLVNRNPRCRPRAFTAWVKRMRARRQRLHDSAARCEDEDAACVSRYMHRILRANRAINAQRRRCNKLRGSRSQFIVHKAAWSVAYNDADDHVNEAVWRWSVSCTDMRKGFARWLAYMRGKRQRLHDSVCVLCTPTDTACVKERFRRIMRVQKAIRSGRSQFTDLVTRCDKCAPLRLRYRRWARLQQQRRARLHAEICKCVDDSDQCISERVEQIKKIQARLQQARAHIFHMNEGCHDIHRPIDHPVNAFTGTPSAPPQWLRLNAAASMVSSVLAVVAVVAALAVML